MPLANTLDEKSKIVLLPEIGILVDLLRPEPKDPAPSYTRKELGARKISLVPHDHNDSSPLGRSSDAILGGLEGSQRVKRTIRLSEGDMSQGLVHAVSTLSVRNSHPLHEAVVSVFTNTITFESVRISPLDSRQTFLEKALVAFKIPEKRQYLYTISLWTESNKHILIKNPMDCLQIVERSNGQAKFHLHRIRHQNSNQPKPVQFEGTCIDTWKPREGVTKPRFRRPSIIGGFSPEKNQSKNRKMSAIKLSRPDSTTPVKIRRSCGRDKPEALPEEPSGSSIVSPRRRRKETPVTPPGESSEDVSLVLVSPRRKENSRDRDRTHSRDKTPNRERREFAREHSGKSPRDKEKSSSNNLSVEPNPTQSASPPSPGRPSTPSPGTPNTSFTQSDPGGST